MGMFNYFFIKHLLSFHYVLGARGAMVRDKMQSLLLRAIGKKHKCTSKYYRNEPPGTGVTHRVRPRSTWDETGAWEALYVWGTHWLYIKDAQYPIRIFTSIVYQDGISLDIFS